MVDLTELLAALPANYNLADRELVAQAYRFAENAHQGQIRASGEAFINHCVAVALILAEMYVPPNLIVAGLLHDVTEDTPVTLEQIQQEFGADVAHMVDGVTKLTNLPRVNRSDRMLQSSEGAEAGENLDASLEEQAIEKQRRSRKRDLVTETIRKTFLAMGDDVRVVLIKLSDRLINMRALSHLPESRQRRIAQETLEIFSPLANRLGIWQIKWQLEDLAFRYVNPEKYEEIARNLAEGRTSREEEMARIKERLVRLLEQNGIKAEISARPKHIYSIYRKMERKGVPFDLVHDVRAVRLIVGDVPSCYIALGLIHTNWRPIPGEFDDYIAGPKDNFYRSLHTTVVYEDGKNLEVQIRTQEMHHTAEYGIAAHWRYKEGMTRDEEYEKRIVWLRSLMEWRQDVEDAKEFVDGLDSEVFQDRVYVFTPRGDIIDLPIGATPIDFAYHVHTDVGHRCRGAKVDGKLASLDYQLKTGEKVDILTAKRGGPSRDWLNPNLGLVNTDRARSKIRAWFKKQAQEHNAAQGKALLEKELRRLGLSDVNLERMAREFELKTVDDLYYNLGTGDLPLAKVVKYLTLDKEEVEEAFVLQVKPAQSTGEEDTVSVLGLKGLLTSIARCCNPAPGDPIVGYVTRGRGATIHRQDCPNIRRVAERERLVRVTWGEPKVTYPVPIRIKAYDRNGLMKDVWTMITEEGINITKANVDVDRVHKAVFDLVIEVRDIIQLSRILDRLENVPNVMEAVRVRPG